MKVATATPVSGFKKGQSRFAPTRRALTIKTIVFAIPPTSPDAPQLLLICSALDADTHGDQTNRHLPRLASTSKADVVHADKRNVAAPTELASRRQPRNAASIAAMSIFFISIMASNAHLAAAGSRSAMAAIRMRGAIYHDSPHLPVHHPHALVWPPCPTMAFHGQSVSA